MSSSSTTARYNQRSWINTFLYLGVTIISALLGLGSAVLLTHHLEPHEYGRIGIFLSVLYLAAPMVFLAADGLVAVNKSKLDKIEYDRFRRSALAIALMVFTVLQFVALQMFLSGNLLDPLLLLVPLFALLRFLSSMASTEYIAEQRAAVYAGLTLLSSLLALALTYLLVTQVFASASARILALMCADMVMLIFRYWGRMGQVFRPYLDIKYRKQIITFGLPSMLALFGAWGLNESDKVIVANEFGLATAGLYTAAASLATIMFSFTQSLTNAFFPHMFAELRRGERVQLVAIRWFLRFLGVNTIFAIVMAIGYFLCKDLLLPVKYTNVSSYFYALVAASLGVAAYRPFGLIAEYLGMARTRAFAIIAGGGTTMCTAFFGVRWLETPLMAAFGIGTGYLVTTIILAVALWLNSDDSSQEAGNNVFNLSRSDTIN
jgi:O-antigen/teichoic acid export membrane protein